MEKRVNIYISGKRRITIPVNPEEVRISYPGGDRTANILALGEVLIPGLPGLVNIGWESFFPYTGSHFEVGDGIMSYLNFFREVQADPSQVLEIVISEMAVTLKCRLEKFEYWRVGGDDDCHYSVDFTMFRDYSPKIIGQGKAVNVPSPSTTMPRQVTSTTRRARAVASVEIPDLDSTVSRVSAIPTISSQPTSPNPASETLTRDNPTAQLAVGTPVRVWGEKHSTSSGGVSLGVETNTHCKVHLIDREASFPINISTLTGSPLGWVELKACSLEGSR
jgi:hypothetical protein